MKTIAFVLGALLIVVAVIYLMVPADSRPAIESTLAELMESRRAASGHRARRLRERA